MKRRPKRDQSKEEDQYPVIEDEFLGEEIQKSETPQPSSPVVDREDNSMNDSSSKEEPRNALVTIPNDEFEDLIIPAENCEPQKMESPVKMESIQKKELANDKSIFLSIKFLQKK